MYEILLTIHNLARWLFLAAALYAMIRALQGVRNQSPFGKSDKTAGAVLLSIAHSQLLIGLVLWFISPKVQDAIAMIGASMKDSDKRLQILEHPLTMILAVVLIQIGRIKSKKAYADSDKHKRSLMYYGLGLVMVLSRIPWGNTPLFRF